MNITTREMIYHTDNAATLKSYLALPAGITQSVPAVLVAPEWWGVSEHPKNMAEKLAENGYAALAIDVYGDGKTTTKKEEANAWMSDMLADQAELLARARLGFEGLRDLPETDHERVAAIGFCFGGKIVLDMARAGLDLKAVATFHGNPTPHEKAHKGAIKGEILVAHGGEDSMVSMAGIEALKAELDAAGVTYRVDIYEGAKHGFTNPAVDARAVENGIDLKYNQKAAEASWQAMLDMLERVFA